MDRSDDDHILDLGLGLTKTTTHHHLTKRPPTTTTTPVLLSTKANCYEPSLTLSLSGDQTTTTLTTPPTKLNHTPSLYGLNNNKLVCRTTPTTAVVVEEAANSTSSQLVASPQYCNSASGVSSLSYNMNNNNNNSHVKRERREMTEEVEVEKVMSTRGGGNSDGDDEEEGNTRKKLRLNKDQSALLEESFKLHSTLNPKQKQGLANQLNLRPRQVEVWFQNRRARTKLKQTEVDCEFLKKCCETLTEENRRLQKELQELKTLKLASSQQPFYISAPTLTMCPSCERISNGKGVGAATTTTTGGHIGAAAGTNSKLPFTNTAATKSHLHHHHRTQFYNSYTNPSAAC